MRPQNFQNERAMKKFWRIYPTEPVQGFTQTFMKRVDDDMNNLIKAVWEQMRWEKITGVKWGIEPVMK